MKLMFDKVIIVSDLGPGDGGKGGVLHKLVTSLSAQAVIKFGGGQGSHGVVTDDGRKFNFSQFGCGTLEGLPTYLSDEFVAIPHGILAEAEALEKVGVVNPYRLLTSSPKVLCATPYHKIASQLRELAFKHSPRGTIGTGVGVAKRLSKMQYLMGFECNLYMGDLQDPDMTHHKLRSICRNFRNLLATIRYFNFSEADQPTAMELFDLLDDDGLLDWTLDKYRTLMETDFRLETERDFLNHGQGLLLAELSHGILTDADYGLKPHVSALGTVPSIAEHSLDNAGFSGEREILGVTRAYAYRHGAGPLPTADDRFLEFLVPGSHKEENRWQGKIRAGPLDFVLLNYSLDICATLGSKIDGICISWFDQVAKTGKISYADCYYDEIFQRLYDGIDSSQIGTCFPNFKQKDLGKTRSEQIERVKALFEKQLGVPVRMISFGPDDKSKVMI